MMASIYVQLHGLRPALIMVVVQIVFAGVNIFYKLAANDGMNLKILIAYRFLFATVFIIPVALIFERKSRPKLTWPVVFQAFLCGFFGGTLAQNLYLKSLSLTSATFASAMGNLVPAITLIMSICFGLERLGLGTLAGKAKVLGTLIGLSGAMLLTFYKGAEVNIWTSHLNLLHGTPHHVARVASSSQGVAGNHLAGALLAVGSCLSYALWLIIQAKMSERYPCHYSSTALMNVMASVQSTTFALCTGKDWTQWKLGWNVRLLTVAYVGIVGSGLMVALMAWCVHVRGPLFVSVFNPLMLLLVAVAGSLLLDEQLHLGSVLGGVLVVCGLYTVIWGKSKEIKGMTQLMPSKSLKNTESMEIVITSTIENNDNSGTIEVEQCHSPMPSWVACPHSIMALPQHLPEITNSLPVTVNGVIDGDLSAKEEEKK
ncbi:WAT1-related protein At1g25270 [Malania oleifera]|uniref:WAT1-related protein At1g25270 n=1 Tax=Malania oleifera TaxID=397392 RepID=UPI0025ADD601|nr:WAT1-related protein At1g25270 [Malania oleifera]